LAIRCAIGASVESLWSRRALVGARNLQRFQDCEFRAPQRKVSSGPNAVEGIIIHTSAAVHRRPRGSPGGTNPGGVVKNLFRSPIAVTSSKIFFLTKIAPVSTCNFDQFC
jgi:hypothetical protein